MRKVPFINGEYYHIYNRGAGKCEVFINEYDAKRFLKSMEVFNTTEPVRSLRDFIEENKTPSCRTAGDREKLVNIICYCLNPNHYHFILEQLVEGGISEFMKRLGGGYTQAFNLKHKRNGVLFQGKFKDVHIESNEQLLYVSAYVNLNNKVHKKFGGSKKHFLDLISERSSWKEYIENVKDIFCKKDIILSQFKDKKDYKKFTEETIKGIKEMRYGDE
ncbi:transposase [Patescibacteria group bacterium]|nr:transposase [Patescibacteria group bacterium]